MTFYPHTWSGQPLIIPIPSAIGKVVTQGAMPAALVMALTVNRKHLVRPSVFLGLISLLVIEAFINSIQARHFGTVYRSFRLAGFVFTLWLLSPWWGRRDLLLTRCYVITMTAVLSMTILGLLVSPSKALGGEGSAVRSGPRRRPRSPNSRPSRSGWWWSCGWLASSTAGPRCS